MNKQEPQEPYPGDNADAVEIFELAKSYHAAAISLRKKPKKKLRFSHAPERLCSIQAIELCLNAFLRIQGTPNSKIRARTHSLAHDTFAEELKLKRKTAAHLVAITEKREYLISRYGPDVVDQHTELTRLAATLDEVMHKVQGLFCKPN